MIEFQFIIIQPIKVGTIAKFRDITDFLILFVEFWILKILTEKKEILRNSVT